MQQLFNIEHKGSHLQGAFSVSCTVVKDYINLFNLLFITSLNSFKRIYAYVKIINNSKVHKQKLIVLL